MSAVFLDTVGLIALWVIADQWHAAADTAFSNLITARRQIVTTRFVLLECGNFAARRPYRNRVSFLKSKLEQRGDLIAPSDEDWHAAWQAYENGEAGQAGVVDHVSFVVMRRMGISEAFTNDQHYRAAGFAILF
jgi:predicted nucleic acid-binding protein